MSLVKKLTPVMNEAANSNISYLQFTTDAYMNAERFESTHLGYRENDKCPDLVAMTKHYAKKLVDFDTYNPLHKALSVLAYQIDGEKNPENAAYHNKFHFADVIAVTANFLEMHNKLAHEGTEGFVPFSEREMAVAMIAAVGHDYKHPAQANPKEDKVLNEANSFARMKADVLDYFEINPKDIKRMETMLYFTSMSLYGYLKEVTKAHETNTPITVDDVVAANETPKIREKVGEIIKDKQLAQMSAILVCADIYGSTCAGIKSNHEMSKSLSVETGFNFTSQDATVGFLEKAVGEDGISARVAKKIALPAFKDLLFVYKNTDSRKNRLEGLQA